MSPRMVLLLMAWLCGPAILVTLAVELYLFVRGDVFRRGRTMQAIVALVATVVAVPIVTVLFAWLLPEWLWHWPIASERPVPPIFFPAILACLIVTPVLVAWVCENTKN